MVDLERCFGSLSFIKTRSPSSTIGRLVVQYVWIPLRIQVLREEVWFDITDAPPSLDDLASIDLLLDSRSMSSFIPLTNFWSRHFKLLLVCKSIWYPVRVLMTLCKLDFFLVMFSECRYILTLAYQNVAEKHSAFVQTIFYCGKIRNPLNGGVSHSRIAKLVNFSKASVQYFVSTILAKKTIFPRNKELRIDIIFINAKLVHMMSIRGLIR